MALEVLGLMLDGRSGKIELSPVLDAADDALVVQDLSTADAGDSGEVSDTAHKSKYGHGLTL